MPMRGELPIRASRFDDRVISSPVWSLIAQILSNDNFRVVFYFCTIGLLLSACVIRAFPDYGATVANLDMPF